MVFQKHGFMGLCQCILSSIKIYTAVVNLIQDGNGARSPPTSFSLVSSTNVRISLQNFLTSPKLLNLNQEHRSEKPVKSL